MDLISTLPAFAVAVVLIAASPGPAMALILWRAALHGLRAALPTVLGLELGLYLLAMAAAAGLAALVAASEVAYLVLRVLGGVFLVYLGVRAWRTAWRDRAARDRAGTGATPPVPPGRSTAWGRAFGEGVVVMLANPRAAVFMIAFYPQFVPEDRPLFATTAVLGLVQVAIELCIYLTLAALVSRAGEWLRRPAVRRRIEAVTGTVLIALGLRVAATT